MTTTRSVWKAGMPALVNGRRCKIVELGTIGAIVEYEDGIRNDIDQKLLKPVPTEPQKPAPVNQSQSVAEAVADVPAAMSRPVSPVLQAEAAPKKRQYRAEGYKCDLCPDLPPFRTPMEKARHSRIEHPRPKAERQKTSVRPPTVTPETETGSGEPVYVPLEYEDLAGLQEFVTQVQSEIADTKAAVKKLEAENAYLQRVVDAWFTIFEYLSKRASYGA